MEHTQYADSNLTVVNVKDTEVIECSNCNKGLMRLNNHNTSKDNEPLYFLTVQCPFCGDKSFQKKVYGTLQFVYMDGVSPINCKMEGKNVYFYTGRSK